jgi:hypothetical protein
MGHDGGGDRDALSRFSKASRLGVFATQSRVKGLSVALSAKECRDNAARCETMALSLIGPANAELRETMREVAAQWRRLAADAKAGDGNRGAS